MGAQEVVEKTWEEIVAIHNAPINAAINALTNKIEKAQELYDSLLEFKTKMENFRMEFDEISSSKKANLTDLNTTVLYNDAKDLYIKGMNKTYVNMVDKRIPPSVFEWFSNMIETKLDSYADDISRWELESSLLRKSLW